MKRYTMEFIGTMFLVLAVGLTGDPLAIGFVLMGMIYMGGHISGAHYNPAITLSIWMRGKLESKYIAGYMISQVLGAVVAGVFCYLFQGKTFAPAPAANAGFLQVYLAEIFFTFALASVILTVATTKKLEGNYIYGLAIGLTVTASAFCVGGISGGAFNPAVGVGPILVHSIISGGTFANLALYLIGPFAGGALAAIVFKFLNPEEA